MNQPGTSYDNSLLLTLGEITQLVVHSHDSAETLDNIVRLIQARFGTAVCSVYYLELETGQQSSARPSASRRRPSAGCGWPPAKV